MPDYVRPVQPMTGSMAQENFGQMVDHVQAWNPDFPVHLIQRRINVHLREAQDRRLWGGLMTRGEFAVPVTYDTGTVALTAGSDVVTGTSTAWPYNDLVNTTLSTAITVVNELQDITPASMTNISEGDYLCIDAGTAKEEYLLVSSITTTTFRSKPTQTHSATTAVITKSSLAGRQLKVGNNRGYYTVIGAKSATVIKIDHVWSHPAETAASYNIVQAYLTMPKGLRCLWSMVNCLHGWRIKFNLPQDILNWDSWRSSTGEPYMLLDYMPDAIGRIRYELYPCTLSATGIPYLAYRTADDLADDEDMPPTCIPSHFLVNATIADALLWNRKSAYYDPASAKVFRDEALADLQAAVMADDNIYMQSLQWAYHKYPLGGPGGNYLYDHDYPFLT